MQDHCGSVSAFSENIDRIIAVLHPVTCPAAVVSARTSHDLLALATSRVQWQRVVCLEDEGALIDCSAHRVAVHEHDRARRQSAVRLNGLKRWSLARNWPLLRIVVSQSQEKEEKWVAASICIPSMVIKDVPCANHIRHTPDLIAQKNKKNTPDLGTPYKQHLLIFL